MRGNGKGTKTKMHQVQLMSTGITVHPHLPKPISAVGKTMDVPGNHWGANCPNGQRDKIFKCIIIEYDAHHTFRGNTGPGQGFKLHETGVDGTGGNSEDFWMQYPVPFLEHYYATFPE